MVISKRWITLLCGHLQGVNKTILIPKDSGTVKLVGADKDRIVSEIMRLLDNTSPYEKMSKAVNPYGDGRAAELKYVSIASPP
ncbi:MAG: UDP-N-acetylglucosamine 2-epimerase [Nitrospirota bacterium]